MKPMQRKLLAVLTVSLLLTSLLFAQGYVDQSNPAGAVNWTQQLIRATGIGAPNPNMPLAAQRAGALTAAKSDALRNLLEVVKGVNLTSETTVENAMLASDVITTRVSGVIRGYKIIDRRYLSTGDVEIDVEVPLSGIMMDALLPPPGEFGTASLGTAGASVCPTCGQPLPAGKTHSSGGYSGQTAGGASGASGVYTGLVVDARGLGVRPAMAPKLLDESGEEIYGSKYVSREYAVDIGMVGYEKDVGRAQSNERVTNSPLIVKGLKASGPNKTDIMVSSADAARIHSAASNMNFLQHCKVMFVLD